MAKRRALLIGVSQYQNDAITDLPIVSQDLAILQDSLKCSGFVVEVLGGENHQDTGRSTIIQRLRKACRDARGIDTLLLYFSGHGIHYGGQDYLVPADADVSNPSDLVDYLVSTELGEVVECSAETILWVIDACREGVKLDAKAIGFSQWSRGDRQKATKRSLFLIFACGPGQYSQYVSGEEGFSLFTKAFAEILHPQHPACQIDTVLKATQERLNELVAEYQKPPQEIRFAHESTVTDNQRSRIICEGKPPIAENLPEPLVQNTMIGVPFQVPLSPPDYVDHLDTRKRLKSALLSEEVGSTLYQILFGEVMRMLGSIDICSSRQMIKNIGEILTDESFAHVAGSGVTSLTYLFDSKPIMSHRLGIADNMPELQKALEKRMPLLFAAAPAQAGTAAIFTYIQFINKPDHIEVSYEFAHSPEIANRIIKGSFSRFPDACVLGSAAAATVLAQIKTVEYSPLMMMPKISHQVITSSLGNIRKFDGGRYAFIADNPSTTRFYFEKLQRLGFISRDTMNEHIDPDETTLLFSEGDPDLRAAMWFPCYRFNQEWNNCSAIATDNIVQVDQGDQATILFIRNDLMQDSNFILALDIVIRDAWMRLGTSPILVSQIVNEMLRNERYVDILMRVSGAYGILAKKTRRY